MKKQAQLGALRRIGGAQRAKRLSPDEEIGQAKAAPAAQPRSRRGAAASSGMGAGGRRAYTGIRRQPGTPRGSGARGVRRPSGPYSDRWGSQGGGGQRRSAGYGRGAPVGNAIMAAGRSVGQSDEQNEREAGIVNLNRQLQSAGNVASGALGFDGGGSAPAPRRSALENAVMAAGQSVGQSDEQNEEEARRAALASQQRRQLQSAGNVASGALGFGGLGVASPHDPSATALAMGDAFSRMRRTPAPPTALENAVMAAGQSVGQSDEQNEEEARRAAEEARRRRLLAAYGDVTERSPAGISSLP